MLGVGARANTGGGGTEDRGAGVPRRDDGAGVIEGPLAVLEEDPASGPGVAAAAAMRGGIPVLICGVGAKEESRRAREVGEAGGAGAEGNPGGTLVEVLGAGCVAAVVIEADTATASAAGTFSGDNDRASTAVTSAGNAKFGACNTAWGSRLAPSAPFTGVAPATPLVPDGFGVASSPVTPLDCTGAGVVVDEMEAASG